MKGQWSDLQKLLVTFQRPRHHREAESFSNCEQTGNELRHSPEIFRFWIRLKMRILVSMLACCFWFLMVRKQVKLWADWERAVALSWNQVSVDGNFQFFLVCLCLCCCLFLWDAWNTNSKQNIFKHFCSLFLIIEGWMKMWKCEESLSQL